MLRWLRRALEAVLALLILFEEWGWEPLQRMVARIARLPPLGWLERRVAALPPWAALAVFFLPALALLPIKLAALWLIGKGRAGLGLLVIVVAKLVGTAVVARLFQLTQPALMQMAWFARLYGRWATWKAALLARIRASWAWRVGRVAKRRWAQRIARWRHPA
jgi:hypothetical protein